jgi:hypothetical protein
MKILEMELIQSRLFRTTISANYLLHLEKLSRPLPDIILEKQKMAVLLFML